MSLRYKSELLRHENMIVFHEHSPPKSLYL